MPVSYSIDSEGNRLIVKVEGRVDLTDQDRMTMEMLGDQRLRAGMAFLADWSKAEPRFGDADLSRVANFCKRLVMKGVRHVAIVVPEGAAASDLCRSYTRFVDPADQLVRVFERKEEAWAWLESFNPSKQAAAGG